MKEVGAVSAIQFNHLFIGGVPYNYKRQERFMTKGLGIHLQDTVIFEYEMIANERVLTYLKNATYASPKEIKMVKDFITAQEMRKNELLKDDLSDQIKKDLAEEGLVITNDGTFIVPPAKIVPEGEPMEEQELLRVPETAPEPLRTDFDPEDIKLLLPDQKRQLSIILQSSLKLSLELTSHGLTPYSIDVDGMKALAIELTEWVDRNSIGLLVKK